MPRKDKLQYNEYMRDRMRKSRGTPGGRGRGRPRKDASVRENELPMPDATDCQPVTFPITLYNHQYSKDWVYRAFNVKPFVPIRLKPYVFKEIKAQLPDKDDIDGTRL